MRNTIEIIFLYALLLVCTLASLWIGIWATNIFGFLLSLVSFFENLLTENLFAPWVNFLLSAVTTLPFMVLMIYGALMPISKIDERHYKRLELSDFIILLLAAGIVLISCETRMYDSLPGFLQAVASFFHDTLKLKLWGPLSDAGTYMTMLDISLGISVVAFVFVSMVNAEN